MERISEHESVRKMHEEMKEAGVSSVVERF